MVHILVEISDLFHFHKDKFVIFTVGLPFGCVQRRPNKIPVGATLGHCPTTFWPWGRSPPSPHGVGAYVCTTGKISTEKLTNCCSCRFFRGRLVFLPTIPLKALVTVKVKVSIALRGKPFSELRDVTCYMGLQCYLPPDTSECTSTNQPVSWYSIYLGYPRGIES